MIQIPQGKIKARQKNCVNPQNRNIETQTRVQNLKQELKVVIAHSQRSRISCVVRTQTTKEKMQNLDPTH
jgi:hypothetical protein